MEMKSKYHCGISALGPIALALGALAGTQLVTHTAQAEEASAAETGAARSLAVDGLKLAQSGNCTEAVPKLERAEKLYHSTVVAIRLGECYVDVGRLVEGTEILRKSLREPLPPDPPAALAKALERAQHTLDTAKPHIGGLTIKVTAVPDMSLRVDGKSVSATLIDTEVPMDPGEHVVEATAPGYIKSTSRVSLSDAEKKSVTITLARDPNAPVPVKTAPAAEPSVESGARPAQLSAPASSAPQETPTPSAPSAAPNRIGAYVALGFGVVGLGIGGVFGVIAMNEHSDLKATCPDNACQPESRTALDTAKRNGNISTIAFGAGAAGVVLGTVLYFAAGSGSSAQRDASAPRHEFAGFSHPRADIGPRSVAFGADF
jgi:hypothetical protein